SALERNAPALLGVGYIEKLADEMTRELQRQVASARRRARMGRRSRTVALAAKGIAFGLLRIEPDGQRVDYSGMQGVDQDLVVKPFGWKGHTASLRRFVDNALQTHLGIQTVAAVARHCRDPHPELMGSGLDCEDPDSDGVRAEFTEGQLTALSVYLALEQIPIRVMPTDPLSLRRAGEGQALFGSLGCISCHVRELPLDSPVHVEVPDLTPGPSYRVDLTVDGREPRLRRGHDGRLTVELWSDLKRPRLGPAGAKNPPALSVIRPALPGPLTPLEPAAAPADNAPSATRHDLQLGRRLFHVVNGVSTATAYALLFTHEQVIHIFGTIACVVYVVDRVRIAYPEAVARRAAWVNRFFVRAEEQFRESAMIPYAIAV